MSMYSRGTTGGVAGALAIVFLVGARVYLRMQRYDRSPPPQYEQVDEQDEDLAEADSLDADSLAHAHEMMDLAPNVDRVGPYLHWSVRTHHEAAWAKTNGAAAGATSIGYRDALFDLMLERSAKDGRAEESKTLQRVKALSKAAGETWWNIKKK